MYIYIYIYVGRKIACRCFCNLVPVMVDPQAPLSQEWSLARAGAALGLLKRSRNLKILMQAYAGHRRSACIHIYIYIEIDNIDTYNMCLYIYIYIYILLLGT